MDNIPSTSVASHCVINAGRCSQAPCHHTLSLNLANPLSCPIFSFFSFPVYPESSRVSSIMFWTLFQSDVIGKMERSSFSSFFTEEERWSLYDVIVLKLFLDQLTTFCFLFSEFDLSTIPVLFRFPLNWANRCDIGSATEAANGHVTAAWRTDGYSGMTLKWSIWNFPGPVEW